MSATEMPVYRFAGCELDPAERRLAVHGRAVTLTPKVFDTLLLLVERAGHVVSKDELMQALWPRGFVHESNLTKHIWLIRKALGDSENDSSCIETVPKLGYRFIAPVQVGARGDDSRRAEPMIPAGASTPVDSRIAAPVRAHIRYVSAALLLGALAIGAIVWTGSARRPDMSASAQQGTAVAIVDFNNLSQNAKDAWLGPALVEMLGIEVAIGDHVYVVPDELVRTARSGLAVPLAGGYASQSLATLRKRLGADYVLSGSYLVSGAADTPTLRIDLALQDAQSGRAVAHVSQSGAVAELATLVTNAGAALRSAAGFRPISAAAVQSAANAQPPTADVARRIGFALDALHRNDPARARDELLDAIAQAPGYAPAYSYLAQAWSALGYSAKAAAAAEQAASRAQALPEEQRLQIDLQHQATLREWKKAADVARALVKLRPDNPDYRLRLIQMLLAAYADADAAAALADLRGLGDVAGDPRIELAAADIASARDDTQGAAVHAREALRLAEARGEPGQIADAQTRLGAALSYLGDADAPRILKKAIATYQQNGNPHGEASAREALGKAFADANQGDPAREEYQRAMAIYQGIGDLGGMEATYSDLARMLWSGGDRDGASTAARHVLDIGRETGDLRFQTWGLQALATAEADEAASDEVLQEYREIVTLNEKSGNNGGLVWTLSNYADVLRMRGELAEADTVCQRAKSLAAELTDPQFVLLVTFNCAQVALDRGDIATATSGVESAMKIATASADTLQQSNAELTLALIDMGSRRWSDARPRLERAAAEFEKAEARTGAADAEASLALCADSLGDAAARDRAADHARELRRGITEHQEVFAADIALAVLRTRAGDASAIADLRAMAADADHRHWLGWSLESRLAAVEAMELRHDPAAAPLRAEVASTAREHGFGWVLTRLGKAPGDIVATRH